MRCSQLEQRLNDVLDRREDPLADDAITAHVAKCNRCRRWTAAYIAVAEATADLSPTPTVEIQPRRIRRRLAAGTAWAVAAGVLTFLSLGPREPAGSRPSLPAQAAVVAVAPDAAPPAGRNASVAELVRHPCRAYVDLVHGTARGLDEAIVLASSLPAPDELLAPVLFPDDGLLKQLNDRWIPAAGETLDTLEQVLSAEATVRS
jgi:hypothetical protein